jgi:riboflavin kinase/FMN adenylyltransferase
VHSPTADTVAGLALGGRPTLVAIGNFDGVHRGHQAVLAQSARLARARGLVPVAMTFEPHPTVAVGRPPPPFLTNVERKTELVERIDPDLRVLVQRFDAAFASQSPQAFARDVLVGRLCARVVRVGTNFRFGASRSGDIGTLVELGRKLGFEVDVADLLGDGAGRYSSTRARECVAKGDLAGVLDVLGRPHALSGLVIEGQKRARHLGFPTANLGWVAEALPPNGVYAVALDRLQPPEPARRLGMGVSNVGVRPTVDAGFAIEAHLFDFDGDLYGARLRVHLLAHLRPERKFSGLEQLAAQIRQDVVRGREALAGLVPAPDASQAWF